MITKNIGSLIEEINGSLGCLDLVDGVSYAYRLIDEAGDCVYAGQTENLKRRIIQHLYDGKSFCDVKFIRCLSCDSNDAEALSIARNKPQLNKQLPTNRFFVTYKSLCDDVAKVLLDDRIILELPSGSGKYRYISSDTARKIINSITEIVSSCDQIIDYDFDSAEALVALGEDK